MQVAAHLKTQVIFFLSCPIHGFELIHLVLASIFFQVGWTAIFTLNFAIIGANLLYILFVVKDKQKPAEKRMSGDCFVFSQKLIHSLKAMADFYFCEEAILWGN